MITIITINLNNKNGLKRTIESVINQTYRDKMQYIIIDGDSNDGSKEIINQYKDNIDYWVSEKDNGLYNAMNKGIQAATNDYCLFLNSGDYLSENNVIQTIYDSLDADIVYGDEYKLKTNGTRYLAKYPNKIDESFFKCGCGENLSFLLQLYCPLENKNNCFHRMIYVFFCQKCWKKKDLVKVLRLNLPEKSSFYDGEEILNTFSMLN